MKIRQLMYVTKSTPERIDNAGSFCLPKHLTQYQAAYDQLMINLTNKKLLNLTIIETEVSLDTKTSTCNVMEAYFCDPPETMELNVKAKGKKSVVLKNTAEEILL